MNSSEYVSIEMLTNDLVEYRPGSLTLVVPGLEGKALASIALRNIDTDRFNPRVIRYSHVDGSVEFTFRDDLGLLNGIRFATEHAYK